MNDSEHEGDSNKSASLQGSVFLGNEDKQAFNSDQIQLLAAIGECGSISAAARKVGISYKTAWDRIDAMNNMSDQPLVSRAAGGAKGGGTTLTKLGQQIIAGFQELQEEHSVFLARLGDKLQSVSDVANFMRSNTMRSSARNQYRGRISKIIPGVVNSEVEIQISDSVTLVAHITQDSREELRLKEGDMVIALIKSSWVIISTDINIASSARNKLVGTVANIIAGAVNSEVVIDLGDSKTICAIVTNTSVEELGLQQGTNCCALFKASSIILMQD